MAELVKGTDLEIALAGAKTRLEGKGLYFFNADQRSVKVLDGKAIVMQSAGETTLKKDDAVFLASEKPLKKRDFTMKAAQEDPLYVWSKVRSEAEAQANASMAQTIAVNGGWYGPGWYWNPYWADYAFVPGAGFLYSPFGWGFYSPAFVYSGFYGGGLYGRGLYSHGFYGHAGYGHVAGLGAGVRSFSAGGFHGGRR